MVSYGLHSDTVDVRKPQMGEARLFNSHKQAVIMFTRITYYKDKVNSKQELIILIYYR